MVATAIKASSRTASMGTSNLGSHLGFAVASAVMLGLCFPWPGVGWLAYVALVPIGVLAVRSHRPWRLAWVTWAVFSMLWILRLRWLMPVTTGGAVAAALVIAAFMAAAVWALNRIAGGRGGGGSFRGRSRKGAAMVVALPVVWVSVEFLRCRYPFGGFGWFCLAHTQAMYQVGQSPGRIEQVADLFGQHTIALVVAMTNGLIVDLLTRPIFRSTPASTGRRKLRRTLRGGLVLWLLVSGGSWAYGQYRLTQTPNHTTAGPRLAVVQTNVPQSNKNQRTPRQTIRDWAALGRLTREASQPGEARAGETGEAEEAGALPPDLIVWPETTVPAGLNAQALAHDRATGAGWDNGEVLDRQIRSLVRSLGAALVVGAPAYEDWRRVTDTQGRAFSLPDKNYNSAFVYDATGERLGARYDKIHRVPFGEYIPVAESWPWLKEKFIAWFSPYPVDYTVQRGAGVVRYTVAYAKAAAGGEQAGGRSGSGRGGRPRREDISEEPSGDGGRFTFATPICYEDIDPALCRRMVYGSGDAKLADVLVNLTNSAWYPGHSEQPQQLQIATLRCIENRVPMARSVNGGISALIDSTGGVTHVVQGPDGATQWIAGHASAELRLDARRTLYGRVGDVPMALLTAIAAATLGVSLVRSRGRRRRRRA